MYDSLLQRIVRIALLPLHCNFTSFLKRRYRQWFEKKKEKREKGKEKNKNSSSSRSMICFPRRHSALNRGESTSANFQPAAGLYKITKTTRSYRWPRYGRFMQEPRTLVAARELFRCDELRRPLLQKKKKKKKKKKGTRRGNVIGGKGWTWSGW